MGRGLRRGSSRSGRAEKLREAKTLREEQAQPYVVVFTDESGGDPRHIDLVVKNFGMTAATDIRVAISPPVESAILGGTPTRGAVRVPEVIPVLVPGQEWRTFWDFTPERASSDLPRSHSATVAFKDIQGRASYSFTFEIDWQVLIDRGFITIYTEHDAARALREISELLRGWKESGGAGLRVVTRDGDKKDQRERDYSESRKRELHDDSGAQ